MALVSAAEKIGITKSSSIAVATSGFQAIPVDAGSFTASESFENVMDTGRRGVEAMDFGSYQGVGSTEISFDMPLMYGSTSATKGSVIGTLLRNLLGTGAPASGATSGLRFLNLTATNSHHSLFRLGSTKEYLTIQRDSSSTATAAIAYGGCRVSEMTFTFNAGEGAVTCSASLTGKTGSSAGTTRTLATDQISDNIQLGWEQALKAGSGDTSSVPLASYTPTLIGETSFNMISADVTLSREITPVYSMSNSQDFSDIYLGPLEVTFSAVMEINAATLVDFRGNSQGKCIFTASSGARGADSARGIAIGMNSATLLESPLELDSSGAYMTMAISGRALATGTTTGPIHADDYTKRSPIEIGLVETDSHNTTAPTYD